MIHTVHRGLSQNTKHNGVAPHYLIARNGDIYQLVTDKAVAYHAGNSKMPDGRTNVNNFSIGVELIYAKNDTPTEVQYDSLSKLVDYLVDKYKIPLKNIVGHEDISPANRQDDPANFDWNKIS
ncbi:N-acetylmuramoyl-L-alanine amidase [Patescibacteria group bacterium]|nr:N-acetylmuramoyl-L-alanine amidase [Patescibacteria group bacterium]MBU4162073.1 N-acetylmuramoyl-L-alanine amidase [Patescibacteria group bacterium]